MYGKFLKHYADKCESLQDKEPSRVYKVNYTKLIKQLWATEISDHFPEDAKIKIANVNFGLLEKGTNKSSKSFAVDSLREAFVLSTRSGRKD